MLNDKVLILCDDPQMGDFWSYALGQIQVSAFQIKSDESLIEIFIEQTFDLVIIDQCAQEQEFTTHIPDWRAQIVVPLLLLVSSVPETYIIHAYRLGIDECIVKPISPRLFQAKVQSWLNRSWTIPATMLDTFKVGDVQLDPTNRKYINHKGDLIKLTNLEFRLLHLLMSHPGQVLDTEHVISRVWGYENGSNVSLLKNMVYRLRRKIEPDPYNPQYILSASGYGYLFRGP